MPTGSAQVIRAGRPHYVSAGGEDVVLECSFVSFVQFQLGRVFFFAADRHRCLIFADALICWARISENGSSTSANANVWASKREINLSQMSATLFSSDRRANFPSPPPNPNWFGHVRGSAAAS